MVSLLNAQWTHNLQEIYSYRMLKTNNFANYLYKMMDLLVVRFNFFDRFHFYKNLMLHHHFLYIVVSFFLSIPYLMLGLLDYNL